jgi:hypothetical protein
MGNGVKVRADKQPLARYAFSRIQAAKVADSVDIYSHAQFFHPRAENAMARPHTFRK